MTWKIKVEYLDEKTGEHFVNEAVLTDEIATHSNLDALDLAFQEITDEMYRQLKEKT